MNSNTGVKVGAAQKCGDSTMLQNNCIQYMDVFLHLFHKYPIPNVLYPFHAQTDEKRAEKGNLMPLSSGIVSLMGRTGVLIDSLSDKPDYSILCRCWLSIFRLSPDWNILSVQYAHNQKL
jgi:hypothetical protein